MSSIDESGAPIDPVPPQAVAGGPAATDAAKTEQIGAAAGEVTQAPLSQPRDSEDMRVNKRPVPSEGWRPIPTLRLALRATQNARVDRDQALLDEDEAHRAAYEARVALEGKQELVDRHAKRRASLVLRVLGAIALAAIDTLPAYWASQALDTGPTETALVTALFVAALTGFAILMSHFSHAEDKRGFRAAILLAALLVALETGLRTHYLIVVNNARWSDWVPDVAILALVTAGLVWISYKVLLHAESIEMFRLRRKMEALDSAAERASDHRKHQDLEHQAAYASLAHLWKSQVDKQPELLDAVAKELSDQNIEADVTKRAAAIRTNP